MKTSRSLQKIFLCAIALSLLAAALIVALRSPSKLPPSEMDRSALVLRDGRLWAPSATAPFTGLMTERYANGAPKSRSSVSDGVLHGLSQGWHTNGVLQVNETFIHGKSEGLRAKWFETGAKESEAHIADARLHGSFRRWHQNGQLAEIVHLKDGQPDGVSWAFYPSGYARATARHDNGALKQNEFWKDGEHKLAVSEITGE